jgi:hypothetical protein
MLKSLYGIKPFAMFLAKLKFHISSKLARFLINTVDANSNIIITKKEISINFVFVFSFTLSPI